MSFSFLWIVQFDSRDLQRPIKTYWFQDMSAITLEIGENLFFYYFIVKWIASDWLIVSKARVECMPFHGNSKNSMEQCQTKIFLIDSYDLNFLRYRVPSAVFAVLLLFDIFLFIVWLLSLISIDAILITQAKTNNTRRQHQQLESME